MTYIFSHRCNGFGYVENSRKAITAALKSKADGIELDIRSTKDNKLVIMHDPYLDRLGKGIGAVGELTGDELKKNKLLDGQNIVLLEQMLPAIKKSKKQAILELKDPGNERQIIQLLKKHRLNEAYLASWNPEAIKLIKEIDPNTKALFIYIPIPRILSLFRMHKIKHFEGDPVCLMINKTPWNSSQYTICLNSHVPISMADGFLVPHVSITRSFIKKCKERKKKIFGFNVNNSRELTQLTEKGIYAVVSDRFRTLQNRS